jgi:type IV fimbrial biogenesis protein FimT
MCARQLRGFTIIELLIVIAILSILLTLGVPSFRDFMLNSRMTSQANDFVLALAYAKSEAVKRNLPVTVCSRATDDTCAGNTTWDTGWLVFLDTDSDGDVDGEAVLQVRAPLEGNNTLRAGNRPRVTFRNTGFSPGFNDTFNLCDFRGVAEGRTIVVSNLGRVTMQRPAGGCP